MNVLKSEKLKLKNSKVLAMGILVPIICGVFSVLFGGTYNAVIQTIYWWTGSFLYFLLQSVAYIDLSLENKINCFNIKSINLQKSKIYISKIFWVIYYGLIGNFILLSVILFFGWSMPTATPMGNTKSIAGIFVIFINCLWIIPFFILLQEKINGLLLMLLNFIISFVIAPFAAGSKFFFLLPYTYAYKAAKFFFKIKEAGDPLSSKITEIDSLELGIGTFLSISLFMVLSFMLCRRERND